MGTHPCPVLSSRECEQRPKDQGRKQLPVPDQSTERPWVEPLSHSVRLVYTSLHSGCWGSSKQTKQFLPS